MDTAKIRIFGIKLGKQDGIALFFFTGVLIMLLSFVALAIDIGYLMVSRNELQNAADASALAGTRLLGSIYEAMPYEAQQTYVADPAPIIARAKTAALNNQVALKSIELADDEVEIGQWDGTAKTFTSTLTHPDAIRITAHRDDAVNGKISTFFARVFGIGEMGTVATATAALSGNSSVGQTGLPIPVGISRFWFDNPPYCNQPIKFNPTGTIEGCAGWNCYEEKNANDAKLRGILQGLLEHYSHESEGYISPPAIADNTYFQFTGGNQSDETFYAFRALFDYCKTLNDGDVDGDNDANTWTARVPVYDWADCSNPKGSIKIAGFTTVTIDSIQIDGKIIMGHVVCNYVEPGRGSGGEFGTMGSIPGLVQ